VTGARLQAVLPSAAFAVLAAALSAIGALPAIEAWWVSAAVLVAFVPSGLLAPGGWRRFGAEALLIPVALAMTVLADPTMRRMALPPLLLLAAWGATAAARARSTAAWHPWLAAALALAARAAGGLGLAGAPLPMALLACLAPAVFAWGASRFAGSPVGLSVALASAVLPLERHWEVAAAALAVGVIAAFVPPLPAALHRRGVGWIPGLVGLALATVALAAWSGLGPGRAWPSTGVRSTAVLAATVLLTPWLPPGLAGAAWLVATVAAGPVQPAPPDVSGVALTAEKPRLRLPAATDRPYVLDVSLANAGSVADGTEVATITAAGERRVLRAGRDTAEWAHERPDVHPAHSLPAAPVWRPGGHGTTALWGASGRVILDLPPGTAPVVERDPALAAPVTVVLHAAGPSRPTPPRDATLPQWLFAGALVVAAVQLLSGTWRNGAAVVAWALLAAASLAGRVVAEPLRLLLERHAPDIVLAALLAAWLPAARVWLPRRRAFLAAATLLVPLAVATPHLTPSLYGDEPFHLIVLDSLARDFDLDLSNNYDLERHPYNRIYISREVFLHSPLLGVLLLPGYVAGGRTGALVLLALAGAALAALLARRAEQLGCQPRRVAMLVSVLLVSLPLATYSTQLWVEVPGALAVAASLVLAAARPHPRYRWATAIAAVASGIKTRLGLLLFPIALAAWRPWRRRGREARVAIAVLAAAAALGLAVSWATFGHPLGYRRLSTLVPRSFGQAATVVGGLLFDSAAGMAFAAPLLLLALLGARSLWRRGGDGERAALVGGGLTVLALLHSHEWYAGGSPPFRYLVPLLPCFVLAGAMMLRGTSRTRALAPLLLPPTVLIWWGLVSRPHFSVNPGDGGWWFADALARRFQAGAQHLFPSFLRPAAATWVVPLVLVLVAGAAAFLALRLPAAARSLTRAGTALWLVAAAALVVALHQRLDTIVEVEERQVRGLGGRPEPPEGTYSRFRHRNGWRIADGQGIEVPLRLPERADLRLEGWLDGHARDGVVFLAAWDGAAPERVEVSGDGPGSVAIPPAPGAGRHRLRLILEAPAGGEAVLDRIVVLP
jgi:hypothetical protein